MGLFKVTSFNPQWVEEEWTVRAPNAEAARSLSEEEGVEVIDQSDVGWEEIAGMSREVTAVQEIPTKGKTL